MDKAIIPFSSGFKQLFSLYSTKRWLQNSFGLMYPSGRSLRDYQYLFLSLLRNNSEL